MMHWEREVLLILEEEIGSLQHGRMPQLPDEFYEAFLRFGRDTYLFFEIEAQDAVVVEEAVYLPPTAIRPNRPTQRDTASHSSLNGYTPPSPELLLVFACPNSCVFSVDECVLCVFCTSRYLITRVW